MSQKPNHKFLLNLLPQIPLTNAPRCRFCLMHLDWPRKCSTSAKARTDWKTTTKDLWAAARIRRRVRSPHFALLYSRTSATCTFLWEVENAPSLVSCPLHIICSVPAGYIIHTLTPLALAGRVCAVRAARPEVIHHQDWSPSHADMSPLHAKKDWTRKLFYPYHTGWVVNKNDDGCAGAQAKDASERALGITFSFSFHSYRTRA